MSDKPLWAPSREAISQSAMSKFMEFLVETDNAELEGYEDLEQYALAAPERFWAALWDFCDVIGDKGGRLIDNAGAMPGARFFPDARLNFAENLLRGDGAGDAIVFRGEDKVARRMSWDELVALTSRLEQVCEAAGVTAGERVAAMLPNMPESIAAMLATASLGGIFSSCSPDFGVRGVLDRFGQIEPKVLIACDGYWYNGKRIEIADKLAEIVAELPSVEAVIIVPYLGIADDVATGLPRAGASLDDAIASFKPRALSFTPRGFNDPLYILFSSGTTGVPKCIVHSVGGTLMKHLQEQRLHSDIRAGDRVFYFTTMGWMMWNWVASALSCRATLLLYDGSPFHPDGNALFDYAQAEGMTLFGASAKYIDAVRNAGLRPRDSHDLSSVRLIASTGSPLAPESFDFVYDAIKPDVHLASISGGTDIIGCFVLGNPMKPVWRGEIQGTALGLAVDVWSDDGAPCPPGVKGELVCTRPFPSMPVMFWNDPEDAKYRAAYFERFPGVWCHGDFAEWTEHGGMIIHGRSDATLNPGGVRIGTAEIYAQVEKLPEIAEALAIGQDWQGDVRIVLFVRLAEGAVLDDGLTQRIKQEIRHGASPRHVPARVVAVADIPRTKSGKITELAVRDVVHGREVKNIEALANPEALELYRDLAELRA